MTTENLDFTNLETATTINRDVMDALFDVYPSEQMFTGSLEEQNVENQFTEWGEDKIDSPDRMNAVVDGANSSKNDSTPGAIVGNRVQTSTREVKLSTGAQAVNSVAQIGSLAHQLGNRQTELRNDVEDIALSEQGSQADDGNTTPGKSGAFFAWIVTNYSGPGTPGGYSSGSITAPTPGIARALSMGEVRTVVDNIYTEGVKADCLMCIPALKSKISEFLYSMASRSATLFTDTGSAPTDATAQSAIGIYSTDHGVLQLKSNNVMEPEVTTPGSERTNVAIYNQDYWALGTLYGPLTKSLAVEGLSDRYMLAWAWTLKCLNERASGAVADIDYTADVVA